MCLLRTAPIPGGLPMSTQAPTLEPSGAATARRLTGPERRSVATMIAGVALLHLLGWGTLLLVIAPQQLAVSGGEVFGVGFGLTAYLLGMRHALDADHIAAIDNTTRKLLTDPGATPRLDLQRRSSHRPLSAGFWFALGHSSVVFVMCLLLALGVKAATGYIEDGTVVRETLGVIGVSVSTAFLFLIGLVNVVVLARLVAAARRGTRGAQAADDDGAALGGVLTRIFAPAMRAVTEPWHMYPLGFLFGLGFDTATEIALLVLAAGGAAVALPWYAILTLPILFAAGMALVDALDGVAMSAAYGWATTNPRRTLTYNIVVTTVSVAAALGIGGVQFAGIAVEQFGRDDPALTAVAGLDLADGGIILVAIFAVLFGVAWVVHRRRRATAAPA